MNENYLSTSSDTLVFKNHLPSPTDKGHVFTPYILTPKSIQHLLLHANLDINWNENQNTKQYKDFTEVVTQTNLYHTTDLAKGQIKL